MPFLDLPVLEPLAAQRLPTSLVVRHGYLRTIGEYPYAGESRPGCGTRVVLRGRRGTELAEVLATTCANSGCGKAITREKVSAYIADSGGRDFPWSTEGRILRIATSDDLAEQRRLDELKAEYKAVCRRQAAELHLALKVVEVEPLLGGETLTCYFQSEGRVDFRGLVRQLATYFHTRILMHQVGARDEARLVADYETCGQHCCCRQFLKVLRPVAMGAAKLQRGTLDPTKVSGRCGRLKCCIRYEEQTYEELRRKLPRVGSRVRTAEGAGEVIDTMILTQLVRVRLDSDRVVAVANEELVERNLPAARGEQVPGDSPPPIRPAGPATEPRPRAQTPPREVEAKVEDFLDEILADRPGVSGDAQPRELPGAAERPRPGQQHAGRQEDAGRQQDAGPDEPPARPDTASPPPGPGGPPAPPGRRGRSRGRGR